MHGRPAGIQWTDDHVFHARHFAGVQFQRMNARIFVDALVPPDLAGFVVARHKLHAAVLGGRLLQRNPDAHRRGVIMHWIPIRRVLVPGRLGTGARGLEDRVRESAGRLRAEEIAHQLRGIRQQ